MQALCIAPNPVLVSRAAISGQPGRPWNAALQMYEGRVNILPLSSGCPFRVTPRTTPPVVVGLQIRFAMIEPLFSAYIAQRCPDTVGTNSRTRVHLVTAPVLAVAECRLLRQGPHAVRSQAHAGNTIDADSGGSGARPQGGCTAPSGTVALREERDVSIMHVSKS